MRAKTMILMGLAVTCGLCASYMTRQLLEGRQLAADEKVEILVARRVLSVGEPIKKPEEMFEKKSVTKDSEPPDAIRDFEVLKGKYLKQGLNKGAHVTPQNFYDQDGLDIPEGHQAVGVPVTRATTLDGLACLPGSRVDLLLTVRGPDAASSSARVLLQNVLVLAADKRTVREGEIAAPAQVVTFALKDEERLRVTLAEKLGTISLSLRKLNDESQAQVPSISGKDILSDGKKQEEPMPEKFVPPVAEQPKEDLPKGAPEELLIIQGARSQVFQLVPRKN